MGGMSGSVVRWVRSGLRVGRGLAMGAMNVNRPELERAMERSAAAPIARAMGKLRRAAWRRLVVERGAGFLAGLVSVVIAAVLVDYLFRLPMGLRIPVWVVALITRVGDEQMGRFIREQLEREGVETAGIVTDKDRLTALVLLSVSRLM